MSTDTGLHIVSHIAVGHTNTAFEWSVWDECIFFLLFVSNSCLVSSTTQQRQPHKLHKIGGYAVAGRADDAPYLLHLRGARNEWKKTKSSQLEFLLHLFSSCFLFLFLLCVPFASFFSFIFCSNSTGVQCIGESLSTHLAGSL